MKMTVGTRSILFGVHSVAVHPFFVAKAWRALYGPPQDIRLLISFLLHDIGYFGCRNMEGSEGQAHVELGARIMARLFGREWGNFCRRHSRYYAREHGLEISRLCVADKLAFVMTPDWLYLPMARASGELWEYMECAKERQAGDTSFYGARERRPAVGKSATLAKSAEKLYLSMGAGGAPSGRPGFGTTVGDSGYEAFSVRLSRLPR
jgi:hypothetical protein